MDIEEYDLVILGGGSGSALAAWTFADQGQGVAVIQRKYIDGSCPNIACLPSKNIIHSAMVAWHDAILTHPTLTEGLTPLFSSVPSSVEATGRKITTKRKPELEGVT